MRKEYPFGFYSFVFIFLLALYSIGNIIERHQSLALLFAFATVIFTYLFLLREKNSFKLLFGIGVAARLLFFFSMPALSDDVYRFIWDGTLLTNDIHPFDQLPSFYLDKAIPGINQELFQKLNSPNYFTIYPPINQAIFWLSVTLGGSNWLISAGVIRILLLIAEVGTFWLLVQLLDSYQKERQLAFLYFLNPLAIVEFVGNLHFEGFVIPFLLLGIYGFEKGKSLNAISGMGLAIGTKLLPLIYMPFLFLYGLRSKKWWYSIAGGILAIATLLPMFTDSFVTGMRSSLDLYFRSFEFNASLYFLARELGFYIYGYNKIAQIGPLLSLLSICSIIAISIIGYLKEWSIPKTLLFILSAYLLFATTVHPWYILPLLTLGVLSGFYFPIVWSVAILITYLGYSKTGFELPLWWVFNEYLIVFIALFLDLKRKKWIINPI